MTKQSSRLLRQLAAVALLLLSLSVVASLTIVPLVAHVASLNEQIDAERIALGRFAQTAAREHEAADYERAGRATLSSGAYLKGDTEALTAAALQGLLAQVAAASGLRFHSTRILPSRERDGLQLIGVRVQFNGDIEQLRAFLHRLETNRPFLFVDALHIRPVSPFSQHDAAQSGVLDVRLDAFGASPGRKS